MGPLKDVPLSGQQTCERFITFFILKRISAENENFHIVSPFLVEEAISRSVGVVKSIRKLRPGDLLIEVSSRKQANQIMKLKALSKIPVSVSPHRSLNFSKGVISSGELFNDETDVILNKLSSQGVTEVRRITIKKRGAILKTKHLILTFRSPKLPHFIKAGYIRYAIRPYIPNPLRCFQCQRLVHAKASCRGTLTCARCAELGHDSTDCKRKEKCVDCKVINQPDTDSFKDFPSKPVSTPCDSPDLSGFITVKKKKKRKKKSTSIKEKNNGNTADQQSKFWTTSLLHISNADSMHVDESAGSVEVNTTTIFDNSVKSPSAILNSEAIPIVSSENEDVIDYDPHETIEDMPPVIEQQQQQQTSTDATCPETATLKRQLKKCHFRLVDFKTFYNEPLSNPVHDKYLKKHLVKRLQ
ncbi:hypothetical protein AVEN_71942-1 [Araneus ventricosus]|uniref:CCHC-type domain-containing protein n=1 Tax=Araneus ventricosus TaxID=182803 RepID=A0A4Y2LZ96_ARAVE|nr:hypothetical protein AVEN_71942-1 [Araneus ventricosus]